MPSDLRASWSTLPGILDWSTDPNSFGHIKTLVTFITTFTSSSFTLLLLRTTPEDMKVIAYSFAAAAIVVPATALAIPALYNRAVIQSQSIACAMKTLGTGIVTPECADIAAIDVGVIRSIHVEDLIVDVAGGSAYAVDFSSSRLTAELLSVPGITWPIVTSAQRVTIVDNGIPLATFDTPISPGSVSGNTYSSIVQKSTVKINPGQEGNVAASLAAFITKSEHTIILRGSVDGTAQMTSISQKIFSFPRIAFESPITLKGCSNFPKIDYLSQGSLTFDSNTGNGLVGITIIKDMKLNRGDNHLTAITTSTSKEAYEVLTNGGGTFTLQGYEGSSTNPVLSEALKALKTQVVVPKLNRIVF
ncbi:hypothetical protein BGZ65_004847 [Modicella reniformis]|uniref:Uncharacterized protein n=1 Tax=Modicella reniformis TaxID=1440133 RepID=A0A9P6J194_9FUNG|nr:hypothetical protein BGZ65_004847 [Modicella reniformis]